MDGTTQVPEQTIRSWGLLEHLRKKTMWVGSHERGPCPKVNGWYETGRAIRPLALEHAPAALTCIDEIIVNSEDHVGRTQGLPKAQRVKYIAVSFDRTGAVTVENDGPGIPLKPVPVSAEYMRPGGGDDRVYGPEACFSIPLSGSELVRAADSIKGGVNGVGAKGMTVNSTAVRVTTRSKLAAADRHLTEYTQTFANRLLRNREDVSEPALSQCPPKTKPMTRVEFILDFVRMGYLMPPEAAGGPPLLEADVFADLTAWMRWRMALLGTYVGRYGIQVTFNGAPIGIGSVADLARLFVGEAAPTAAGGAGGGAAAPNATTVSCVTLKATAPKVDAKAPRKNAALATQNQAAAARAYPDHSWDLAIVAGRDVERGYVSVVSGVETLSGTQRNFLEGWVSDLVEAAIRKRMGEKGRKVRAADTLRNVVIVVACALPGANWNEQRKTELAIGGKDPFAAFRPARPPAAIVEAIDGAADAYLDATGAGKRKKVRIGKYEKPIGPKRPGRRLILDEGDSADRIAQRIRSTVPAGKHTLGTFCLGGVVMNAVEQSRVTGRAGEFERVLPTATLLKNERLSALAQALGLEIGRHYLSDAEVNALPYGGGVLFCVDEDVDGKGKIFPLVLAFLGRFWPELVLRPGWVSRLQTPVVRVYGVGAKRNKASARRALTFFYQRDFEVWCGAHAADYERARRDKRIDYIKGLAGHDSMTEVPVIAERFAENLVGFDTRGVTPDALSALLKTYFGKDEEDGAARKALIRAPPEFFGLEEIAGARAAAREIFGVGIGEAAEDPVLAPSNFVFPPARLMEVDAILYKRSDVEGKMPSALDGYKVTGRKVLATILGEARGRSPPKRKIFQMGGYVAMTMFYHHGDMSLNTTITGMAQSFPGAWEFPPLLPLGEVGSRSGPKNTEKTASGKGGPGKDAGSPRYVGVRANFKIVPFLFRAEDDALLTRVIEDGVEAQPEFFLPVVPLAILETDVTLAEGWAWRSYARDFDAVGRLLVAATDSAWAGKCLAAAAAVRAALRDTPPGPAQIAEVGRVTAEIAAAFPLGFGRRGWDGRVEEVAGTPPPARKRTGPSPPATTRYISYGSAILLAPAAPATGRKRAKAQELVGWTGATASEPTHLRITELPMWIGIEKYIFGLSAPPDNPTHKSESARQAQALLHETIADGTKLENFSTDQDRVDILIPLRPGALEVAAARYPCKGEHAGTHPLFQALRLYSWVTPLLNFLGDRNEVNEFGQNYHAVFLTWYEARRAAYADRLARQFEIARLQIVRLEQTVAFCRADTDLRGATNAIAEERVRSLGFTALDTGLITRLENGLPVAEMPTARIAACVTTPVAAGGTADYGYLRRMRGTSFVDTAIADREKDLVTARARLARIEGSLADPVFPGATLWREEAGEVAAAARAGWASSWCDE